MSYFVRDAATDMNRKINEWAFKGSLLNGARIVHSGPSYTIIDRLV